MKVEDEDEEGSVDEQDEEEEEEEENLEKALSVERFGDIISDSASTTGDRMGRNYTEKDFECKHKLPFTAPVSELQLWIRHGNKCIHLSWHKQIWTIHLTSQSFFCSFGG